MLDVTCPHHGRRVLLGNERIVAMTNDDTGIVVRYRCWCGEVGELHTGRVRARRHHEEMP
jgi:hypothetical protein